MPISDESKYIERGRKMSVFNWGKNFPEEVHDMIGIIKSNKKPEIIEFFEKKRDKQINRVEWIKIAQLALASWMLLFLVADLYSSFFLDAETKEFFRRYSGILVPGLLMLFLLSYVKKQYKNLIEQLEQLIHEAETDIRKEAVEAVINYRKVLADKLAFDDIDEKIQVKFNRYKIVDTDFQIFINNHYDAKNEITVVGDSTLYYCIGYVFDEATNGSEFPFLLNDVEFILARASAMRSAVKICEQEREDIEKYIDFGVDYSKRRMSDLKN
ncbi:hypothetical protein [Phascolarctobacterium sp.]